MHRRDLLKSLLAMSVLPATGYCSNALAAPATQNRRLLVSLRGGYDACSLLIPTSSSFYDESRPNITIARPSDNPQSALELNADWGLHPAFRESIYPMYKNGEVAFIPFAGTDDLTC